MRWRRRPAGTARLRWSCGSPRQCGPVTGVADGSDRMANQAGPAGFNVLTGAFSYSGAAITRKLRASGRRVRTLTGHPGRAPRDTPTEVRYLDFGDPAGLTESLQGAQTLYNTYWVRFPRGQVDHAAATANSRVLFHAAERAGVQRIVHISITHPSVTSRYPYFRGKAEVERHLAESGVPYAVLRPAVLFGGDGVLINNIAWLLRRFPVFAVGGTGEYRIRPIHIDDLARLCTEAGSSDPTPFFDAVGPVRSGMRSAAMPRSSGCQPISSQRLPGFSDWRCMTRC